MSILRPNFDNFCLTGLRGGTIWLFDVTEHVGPKRWAQTMITWPDQTIDKLHHISWATLAFGKVVPSWDHRGPKYPRDFSQPNFNCMMESN
jgi:hypothetical protein